MPVETLIAVIAIAAVAAMFVGILALAPILAARRNPRPADQPAEMGRDEPSSSSDDPGRVG